MNHRFRVDLFEVRYLPETKRLEYSEEATKSVYHVN